MNNEPQWQRNESENTEHNIKGIVHDGLYSSPIVFSLYFIRFHVFSMSPGAPWVVNVGVK